VKEFARFLQVFFSVQVTLFLTSTLLVFFLSEGDADFTLSYVLGYAVMFLDYFFLIRFSRSVPERVFAGERVKPQFWKRFFIVSLTFLLLIQFTPLDFFAIILAVAVATLGVAVSAVKFRKEWEECRSTEA